MNLCKNMIFVFEFFQLNLLSGYIKRCLKYLFEDKRIHSFSYQI